jgi:hypothetical protein
MPLILGVEMSWPIRIAVSAGVVVAIAIGTHLSRDAG